MRAAAWTDGATVGSNPGLGGIGIKMVMTPAVNQDSSVYELALPIGEATNNIAEYVAVIEALGVGLRLGVTDLVLHTDSLLVVSQTLGEWQTKNPKLRPLQAKVRDLMKRYDSVSIRYVPRAQNKDADRLSKIGASRNVA